MMRTDLHAEPRTRDSFTNLLIKVCKYRVDRMRDAFLSRQAALQHSLFDESTTFGRKKMSNDGRIDRSPARLWSNIKAKNLGQITAKLDTLNRLVAKRNDNKFYQLITDSNEKKRYIPELVLKEDEKMNIG